MKQRPYRSVIMGLIYFGAFLASWLPMAVLYMIGGCVGHVVYFILPKERYKVLKHLRFAYQTALSDKELRVIARRVFVNFAWAMTEMMKMNGSTIKFITDKVLITDEDHKMVMEQKQKNCGVIFSSAHIGNWEALAAYLYFTFCDGNPFVVVAKRIYFEGYNSVLVRLRERFSVKTAYRDDSFLGVVRHLKKGGNIGILTDQDVSSIPGIFIKFFGHEALTSDAQAKLALLTGASIIPTFLVREGHHLRFVIDKPIHANKAKDKDGEVVRITQEIADATERVIRRYPDQWAWMHRRWKTRPEDLKKTISRLP